MDREHSAKVERSSRSGRATLDQLSSSPWWNGGPRERPKLKTHVRFVAGRRRPEGATAAEYLAGNQVSNGLMPLPMSSVVQVLAVTRSHRMKGNWHSVGSGGWNSGRLGSGQSLAGTSPTLEATTNEPVAAIHGMGAHVPVARNVQGDVYAMSRWRVTVRTDGGDLRGVIAVDDDDGFMAVLNEFAGAMSGVAVLSPDIGSGDGHEYEPETWPRSLPSCIPCSYGFCDECEHGACACPHRSAER